MFTLPDLPYSADSLEPYIDARTMTIHHDKHHGAYVKNLNDALPGKSDADLLGILKNPMETKVRNNAGGHFNHSLFWTMLAPKSAPPAGKLLDALNSAFGSVDQFREKFTAAAMGRFGSGWAWLSLDGHNLVIEDTPNQDNPVMLGRTPILVLDVWEHAYYLKYQNRRAEYIEAWWNVINWQTASVLFSRS